jgi:hypothetical protein
MKKKRHRQLNMSPVAEGNRVPGFLENIHNIFNGNQVFRRRDPSPEVSDRSGHFAEDEKMAEPARRVSLNDLQPQPRVEVPEDRNLEQRPETSYSSASGESNIQNRLGHI